MRARENGIFVFFSPPLFFLFHPRDFHSYEKARGSRASDAPSCDRTLDSRLRGNDKRGSKKARGSRIRMGPRAPQSVRTDEAPRTTGRGRNVTTKT